ncbi:MAG: hypothetical protein AAF196_02915 [Planctomycetota bacterium]
MVQDFQKPTLSTDLPTAVTELLPNMADSLRSEFSGPDFPENPIEGQACRHTGTGYRYRFINGVWLPIDDFTIPVAQWSGAAALAAFLPPLPFTYDVLSVGVVPFTNSAGSAAGKQWTKQLINWTATAFLFTAGSEPSTDGDEFVANTPWDHTPDASSTIQPNEIVQFVLGMEGAPQAVGQSLLYVKGRRRWD